MKNALVLNKKVIAKLNDLKGGSAPFGDNTGLPGSLNDCSALRCQSDNCSWLGCDTEPVTVTCGSGGTGGYTPPPTQNISCICTSSPVQRVCNQAGV